MNYFDKNASDVLAIAKDDPVIAEWLSAMSEDSSFFDFVPRPDDPANFDEQHSFCYNRDSVAFMVGGNASGTTEISAFKAANFLLHQQPPPRKNTPFWIISNTYDQVCDVCWSEKLLGHGHIPECEIDWDSITWLSKTTERPYTVPLKPWPIERGGHPHKNWRIEFKSYEQRRRAMEARSIGGFWFSEQFPLELFLEVLRGCREYLFPGGQFAEFTPIEPELSIWVEKAMENTPKDWRFYRCNTEKNKPNLKEGWYEQFFALVPDELLDTRKTGALASFQGVIYPRFNRSIHVVDAKDVIIPRGATHALATDWGASEEHPFAVVFGCKDTLGNWLIYDEYWDIDQEKITQDHAKAVLEKLIAWGWPTETYELNGKELVRIHSQRDALWHHNYADPARPGEINEFCIRGIPTSMARNRVYDGINAVRASLKCHPATGEPGIRISSKCQHLIDEMRKYRWMRGRKPESGSILNPQVGRPVPLKRSDDMVDALRYLIFSEAMATGEAITTHAKLGSMADRRSIQLVQNRLEHAMKGAGVGMMPQRR